MYHLILIELIFRNHFQEILLVKRKRPPGIGKWGVPAGNGALQLDPNPFTAIHNEVMMDFHVPSQAKFFSLEYNPEETSTFYLYFTVELLDEPSITPNESFSEYRWFPIREILELDLAVPFDKKIISHIIQKNQ